MHRNSTYHIDLVCGRISPTGCQDEQEVLGEHYDHSFCEMYQKVHSGMHRLCNLSDNLTPMPDLLCSNYPDAFPTQNQYTKY